MDHPPPIILCIPGTWKTRDELVIAIAKKSNGYLFAGRILLNSKIGAHYEVQVFDHRDDVSRMFQIGGTDSLTKEDRAAAAAHGMGLYLIGSGGSLDNAFHMMQAACAILDSGGLAVGVESAGVLHSSRKWRELTNLAVRTPTHKAISLYKAYCVCVTNQQSKRFFSCGMHNLGIRDAILEQDLPVADACNLLDKFLLYILTEGKTMLPGETFGLANDAPVYRLSHEVCEAFAEDNPYHNPYGMWRLSVVGLNV